MGSGESASGEKGSMRSSVSSFSHQGQSLVSSLLSTLILPVDLHSLHLTLSQLVLCCDPIGCVVPVVGVTGLIGVGGPAGPSDLSVPLDLQLGQSVRGASLKVEV